MNVKDLDWYVHVGAEKWYHACVRIDVCTQHHKLLAALSFGIMWTQD